MQLVDIKKSDLLWNKTAREHIKKHSLSTRQVEEVFNKNFAVEVTYKNRLKIIGQCGKRILSVIVVKENKKYAVITTRDSDKEERNQYKIYITNERNKL